MIKRRIKDDDDDGNGKKVGEKRQIIMRKPFFCGARKFCHLIGILEWYENSSET